ncbi:hypothetical protein ABK040_002218 [Willaertia magna]
MDYFLILDFFNKFNDMCLTCLFCNILQNNLNLEIINIIINLLKYFLNFPFLDFTKIDIRILFFLCEYDEFFLNLFTIYKLPNIVKEINKLDNSIYSIIDLFLKKNYFLKLNSKFQFFTIIFQFLIFKKFNNLETLQKDLLFYIFYKSNFPIYFHILFKYFPNIENYEFIKKLSKFLFIEFIYKNEDILTILKTNEFFEILFKFLIQLQKLILNYLKIYNFTNLDLKELLFTKKNNLIKQGEFLLFYFYKENDNFTNLEIFKEIYFENKFIFLNFIEKKFFYLKYLNLEKAIKFLNEIFLEFIVQKKELNNLILKNVFFIIFEFISQLNTNIEINNNFTFLDLFFKGLITIPYYLLKDINITILYYLFEHLNDDISIKSILLLLIIEKCNNSKNVLSSIGGLSFFKNLLQNEKNEQIIYFTSKYLMKHLSQSFPNEYYSYLSNVILKSQK